MGSDFIRNIRKYGIFLRTPHFTSLPIMAEPMGSNLIRNISDSIELCASGIFFEDVRYAGSCKRFVAAVGK